MTIGRTTHPYEEVVPEGRRLRMKDWLKSRIGNPRYPGLVWLDEKEKIFRIPWKHAALHGWDQNCDGALFRDWAKHTGACVNTHPKQLKATFRCALHSLPDVHEERNLAKKRGDDACRVFRMESSYSTNHKRRHIRIRGHNKVGKSNIKQQERREEGFDQFSLSLPVQTNSMPNWNGTTCLPGAYQTYNCTNEFVQPTLENEQAVGFGGQNRFSVLPRRWTTQSNPDIPTHGLLPPTVDVNTEHRKYEISSMLPMQHSQSVPEISQQVHFTDCHNGHGMQSLPISSGPSEIYQNDDFQDDSKNHMFEQNQMPYYQNSNFGPLSPESSIYSPTQIIPSPHHAGPVVGIPSMSSPSHGTDTIAQAVASASAVIESYQQAPIDTSNCTSYVNSNIFGEERRLNPMEAILASGAVRSSESGPNTSEIMKVSRSTASVLPTSMHDINLGFKEYQHASNAISSIEGQSAIEMCQPSMFIGDPSTSHQMLDNVTRQGGLSPNQGEYIDGCTQAAQYATENQTVENVNSGWMSPSQHESMLPSASTLLPSSSSPTSVSSPLGWISTRDESVSSSSVQYYNDMQYDVLSTSPTYTCGSNMVNTGIQQYSDNLNASFSSTTTTVQNQVSMYGGYISH